MTAFGLTIVTQASDGGWWAPAIIAAIVAAVISLATFALAGRRARIDRQRQVFAEAFEAVIEYREYPFIVHRRRGDEAPAERTRISGELSKVQAKLRAFEARLLVEDQRVGRLYTELVTETRRIVGPMIRDAWNAEPIDNDAEIHAAYDLSPLEAPDRAYLDSVINHLSWLPWRP
ncbi:MAG: hypothetical protein ACYC5F_05910 [Thermoleophilia bacterium]